MDVVDKIIDKFSQISVDIEKRAHPKTIPDMYKYYTYVCDAVDTANEQISRRLDNETGTSFDERNTRGKKLLSELSGAVVKIRDDFAKKIADSDTPPRDFIECAYMSDVLSLAVLKIKPEWSTSVAIDIFNEPEHDCKYEFMPECVLQQYRAIAHTDFISVSPPHGTHIREVKLLGDIEYCSSWLCGKYSKVQTSGISPEMISGLTTIRKHGGVDVGATTQNPIQTNIVDKCSSLFRYCNPVGDKTLQQIKTQQPSSQVCVVNAVIEEKTIAKLEANKVIIPTQSRDIISAPKKYVNTYLSDKFQKNMSRANKTRAGFVKSAVSTAGDFDEAILQYLEENNMLDPETLATLLNKSRQAKKKFISEIEKLSSMANVQSGLSVYEYRGIFNDILYKAIGVVLNERNNILEEFMYKNAILGAT